MTEIFESAYTAKVPDENGFIAYDEEENRTWKTLYERQADRLSGRACRTFIEGLDKLALSADTIPQVPDVNTRMLAATGWSVEPVPALIEHDVFFQLLASKRFPAATFIRTWEDLDYVKEPDIFHEIFGHAPMLMDQVFADFVEAYGKRVLTMNKEDWPLMQRLFWFTVEFGLVKMPEGIRAYGGGILSSIEETVYSIDSDVPKREPFDVVTVLRTPYRIDMLQPIYYVLDGFKQMYDIMEADLDSLLAEARKLGELPPLFATDGSVNEHINAC